MKNTFYKHLLFTIPHFFLVHQLSAQNGPSAVSGPNGLIVNSDLHQIYFGKYSGSGKLSPYLYNDLRTGSVKLRDGRKFEDINLLYDQINDKVLFSEDKNQLKEFTDTVAEFRISIENSDDKKIAYRTFRNGYPEIERNSVATYYEVLADGPVQLLKKSKKGIVEETASGAIHKTKQISVLSTNYYVFKNFKIGNVKKNTKSLPEFLEDKGKELGEYVEKEKLNLRQERDLKQLIEYYNQL